jgi:hypothetical protein
LTVCQVLPDAWPVDQPAALPNGTRCSFCLKAEREVAKIIAGPGSYICDECVSACVAILSQEQPDADGDDSGRLPAWRSLTDPQMLERLPRIAEVAAQVEDALTGWVTECRRRGASWARVGAVLAMSRQAAWERFSHAGR